MPLPLISVMTVADLDDIMPLERQVFQDAWTRHMYISDLTSNEMAAYRVARGAAPLPPILAWGGFWLMVDEAHIATVASHPNWRGCGLGQWLMLALLDVAAERGAALATLEVRANNAPAQKLYEKLGFAIVGRRRRYYQDGEDGLIMTSPPLARPDVQERLTAARAEAVVKLTRCFGGAGATNPDATGVWRVSG